MKTKPFSSQVEALFERTADTYSFDRYRSWKACVRALLRRGYNDRQAETLLRSRITRWAADRTFTSRRATSNDLLRYMDEDPRAVFEAVGTVRRARAS